MLARFVQTSVRECALWVTVGVLVTGSVVGAPQDSGPSLKELGRQLSSATAAGSVRVASQTIDQLVALRSVEAYRIIIEGALTGARYEAYPIERRAGAVLAACGDQRVRDEVYRNIRENRNFKSRIILLAVARRYAKDDPKAFDAFSSALRDPAKAVVLTALAHLQKIGTSARPCVEPLIELLELLEKKHQRNRLYFDTRTTLQAVTGFDFPVAADWRNFWSAHKDGKPLPKRREGRTEVVLPEFFSVSIDSDRIYFCIDVSSSMAIRDPVPVQVATEGGGSGGQGRTVTQGGSGSSGGAPPSGEPPPDRERLRRAQRELVRLIEQLPDGTKFGILSFSHELRFWEGSKVLRAATPRNKASAVRWVNALRAMGATRTDLALSEALTVPDVDTMFVLTDGAPRNIQNQRLDIEPILEFAKTQNRFLRAKIHSVSFSQIRDTRMRTFVEKLAFHNGGKCTWLD